MIIHFQKAFYLIFIDVQLKHLVQNIMAVSKQIFHLFMEFFCAYPAINLCDTEYLFFNKLERGLQFDPF